MHMFAAITIIITIVLVAIGTIIIHTHSNHHTIRLPKGGVRLPWGKPRGHIGA